MTAPARSRDLVLGDELGPRGRRRVAVATTVASLVLAGLALVAVRRFAEKGQLDGEKWQFVTDPALWRFLLRGLRTTLTVSLVAMAGALVLGAAGAVGRLHRRRSVRIVAITLVEVLRATPLVLLIYFAAQFLPRYAPDLGSYWYLVVGLVAYNGSVIAEIFRAGILSLGAGQREAGLAVGLSDSQVFRLILFPQGVRRMTPALVNQLVTLLKDSSLGALVLIPAVEDLLHQGKIIGEFEKVPLQALIVTAVVYIAVNFSLSSLARWLERRQDRRFGRGPQIVPGMGGGPGGGDVAVVARPIDA
jgi:glutamate transport system permease protein